MNRTNSVTKQQTQLNSKKNAQLSPDHKLTVAATVTPSNTASSSFSAAKPNNIVDKTHSHNQTKTQQTFDESQQAGTASSRETDAIVSTKSRASTSQASWSSAESGEQPTLAHTVSQQQQTASKLDSSSQHQQPVRLSSIHILGENKQRQLQLEQKESFQQHLRQRQELLQLQQQQQWLSSSQQSSNSAVSSAYAIETSVPAYMEKSASTTPTPSLTSTMSKTPTTTNAATSNVVRMVTNPFNTADDNAAVANVQQPRKKCELEAVCEKSRPGFSVLTADEATVEDTPNCGSNNNNSASNKYAKVAGNYVYDYESDPNIPPGGFDSAFSKFMYDCRRSRKLVIAIVAIGLLLDNMLLTSVVPIIPAYLYKLRIERQVLEAERSNDYSRLVALGRLPNGTLTQTRFKGGNRKPDLSDIDDDRLMTKEEFIEAAIEMAKHRYTGSVFGPSMRSKTKDNNLKDDNGDDVDDDNDGQNDSRLSSSTGSSSSSNVKKYFRANDNSNASYNYSHDDDDDDDDDGSGSDGPNRRNRRIKQNRDNDDRDDDGSDQDDDDDGVDDDSATSSVELDAKRKTAASGNASSMQTDMSDYGDIDDTLDKGVNGDNGKLELQLSRLGSTSKTSRIFKSNTDNIDGQKKVDKVRQQAKSTSNNKANVDRSDNDDNNNDDADDNDGGGKFPNKTNRRQNGDNQQQVKTRKPGKANTKRTHNKQREETADDKTASVERMRREIAPQNSNERVKPRVQQQAKNRQPLMASKKKSVGDAKKLSSPTIVDKLGDSFKLNNEKGTRDVVISHQDIVDESFEVGVMFASKPIFQALANPFIGLLTNKVGFTIPMFTGFVIMFISTIVFALGSTYGTLFAARSLQGIGSACTSVAGMSMLADRFPDDEERGKAMAIALGGLAVGVVIGPPFGGFMYEFVGKSSPFIVLALLALADGLLQLLVLQPRISQSNEDSASLLTLIKDPYILVAAGAITFANCSIAILEPSLPLWMMDTMHAGNWEQGVVFLPAAISYLIGTNFFGSARHKMGRWKAAMIGLILSGCSLLLIPFATSVEHLIIPNGIIGLSLGMVDSTMMPMLGYLVDIRHTSVYGSVYAIGDIAFCASFAFGPALSGTLVELIGFEGLIITAAIICLGFSPLLLLLKNPPPRNVSIEPIPMTSSAIFNCKAQIETHPQVRYLNYANVANYEDEEEPVECSASPTNSGW